MANGCWLFDGSADDYGSVYAHGEKVPAHRFVYEVLVGPIPTGHVLHHRCLTPGCVNPRHLTPLTNVEHLALHKAMRRGADNDLIAEPMPHG